MKRLFSAFSPNTWVLLSAILGVVSGYSGYLAVDQGAQLVADLFVRVLKCVSLPLIFLSVVTALSGMESFEAIRVLGRRVLRYTLLTTVTAASVALGVFVLVDPAQTQRVENLAVVSQDSAGGYLTYLLGIIPTNVVQPFVESHVLGVLFLAVTLGLAILSLPKDNRELLHKFFASLFAATMKMTEAIVKVMPLAVWAFVTLFVHELSQGLALKGIMLYLSCVLVANVIQAVVVLPGLLWFRGYSPIKTFRAVFPALTVAFFTKSSGAALPVAMTCAEENLKISKRVSRFSFPLCVTINMNACAAFILITVLFVSMSHGIAFTSLELISWILIATIAAVGNAGVPMGCYFLASAFLATMNVPLQLMGMILPIYALIDMLETAINVWSNVVVAAVVDKEMADFDEGVLQPGHSAEVLVDA